MEPCEWQRTWHTCVTPHKHTRTNTHTHPHTQRIKCSSADLSVTFSRWPSRWSLGSRGLLYQTLEPWLLCSSRGFSHQHQKCWNCELRNQLPRTTRVLPGALGIAPIFFSFFFFLSTQHCLQRCSQWDLVSNKYNYSHFNESKAFNMAANLYWPWHQRPATPAGKCQALKCHKVLAACVLTLNYLTKDGFCSWDEHIH